MQLIPISTFHHPGLRGSGIQPSLVLGVIVVRFLLLPIIGIVIVKGAIKLGLVHADPLYQFVLLVQYSVPPAMNISTHYISLLHVNLLVLELVTIIVMRDLSFITDAI